MVGEVEFLSRGKFGEPDEEEAVGDVVPFVGLVWLDDTFKIGLNSVPNKDNRAAEDGDSPGGEDSEGDDPEGNDHEGDEPDGDDEGDDELGARPGQVDTTHVSVFKRSRPTHF